MKNSEKNMEKDNKLNILMDSYNTLRARNVVKTWSDFATMLGVNRTCLSAAKQGDEKYLTMSLISKIQGIMKEYERQLLSVSIVPNDIEDDKEISALAAPYKNMRCVPTIPIHAYRAVNFDVMEYFNETQDDLKMSPIVMQFPGTDCYYFVNSEDMMPYLRTNDLLCLSRLPNEAKVTNGDICIINTKYQGILERFVYEDGDALLLKSSQERWTDMRIPKSEIFSVFRILGSIRTNM